MRLQRTVYGVFLLCLIVSTSINAIEINPYPLRYQYPSLNFIETSELKALIQKKQAQVVDVRSEFEYRTLHIAGATHIPLSSPEFIYQIRELAKTSPQKTIVLYCNGETCSKSYKAGLKCEQAKIKACRVYDSGIFHWVKSEPTLSKLYGEGPVLASKLISDEAFKAHLLPADEFISRIVNTDSLVLDIRTPFQQVMNQLPIKGAKKAPLESTKFLKRIAYAKEHNKPLLIFDATGKQVRWCMYYLEKMGITDYYFVSGGVRAMDLVLLNDNHSGSPESFAIKN